MLWLFIVYSLFLPKKKGFKSESQHMPPLLWNHAQSSLSIQQSLYPPLRTGRTILKHDTSTGKQHLLLHFWKFTLSSDGSHSISLSRVVNHYKVTLLNAVNIKRNNAYLESWGIQLSACVRATKIRPPTSCRSLCDWSVSLVLFPGRRN